MTLSYHDISAIIDRHFPEFSGPIDRSTTFDDLSFDSLALIELGAVIERQYGVTLTEEQMVEAETFDALATLVNASADLRSTSN